MLKVDQNWDDDRVDVRVIEFLPKNDDKEEEEKEEEDDDEDEE